MHLPSNLDYRPGPANRPGEIYVCCSFCPARKGSPDTHFHLGLNTISGKYQCFRCGAKPSVTGKISNVEDLKMLLEGPEQDDDEVLTRLQKRVSSMFPKIGSVKGFQLADYSWPICKRNTPIAYRYMKEERGFSDQELQTNSIRVGSSYYDSGQDRRIQRWAGRVLFPYFDGPEATYFLGRSYNGKKPKYLNCNASRSNIVYEIGWDKGVDYVMVVEGVISGISANRNSSMPAAPTLGKQITRNQMQKIRSRFNRGYVCFDGDLRREEDVFMKCVAMKGFLKLGFEVYNMELPPGMDPDEVGLGIREYISAAKPITIVDLLPGEPFGYKDSPRQRA